MGEYCPRCQTFRLMQISKFRGGKTVTTSYHCATCGSFVRSEVSQSERVTTIQSKTKK
jgi:transposase-like protein